ncbi:hypothetical protein KHP62_21075 [Rhodobacteraceae bacterium NNCM2]|nr:hypothetical protein [Coraliihabitans acroporae]
MKRLSIAIVLMGAGFGSLAITQAADKNENRAAERMAALGSVSEAQGRDAWSRIEAVVTHPRCANCHTDKANVPMWSGPSYGKARPHGMNVNAGESRIGAETLPCSTCHMTSTAANTVPHAAPHVGLPWQLAPTEFVWFGKSGGEICAQMTDPERNGGRDAAGLVGHLLHEQDVDGFVPWGWKPGGDRSTPPGTFESHIKDMVTWAAAGMPCPE